MAQPLFARLVALLLAFPQLPAVGLSPAPPDINLFVRGVLEDRFLVEGFPEQGFFDGAKQIDVQREIGNTFFVLEPSALPRAVPGIEFRLRDRADLQREAAASIHGVRFVKINRPMLNSPDAGTINLEMGFIAPAGSVALCCCSEDAAFRRVNGEWRLKEVFGWSCS